MTDQTLNLIWLRLVEGVICGACIWWVCEFVGLIQDIRQKFRK